MDDNLRLQLTTAVVTSFMKRNQVQQAELPTVIRLVHHAFSDPEALAPAATQPTTTKAQIRKSIRPDSLISFIDGRPYKQLKRRLTGHGYTPQSYRRAFGLPADYPMVAAEYAARRSALAKAMGLGERASGRAGERASGKAKPVRGGGKGSSKALSAKGRRG